MEKPRAEFVKWLEERIEATGGLRASAEKAGVAHGTLIRGLQGGTLTLATLEGISKWTGVSLVRVLQLYGEDIPEDERLESALARVLDEYPQLRETLLNALGVLDDEAIAEVIQYIDFQVQRRDLTPQ
jgi:transcriptional regulator with XRE-family HTH domain